MLSLLSYLIRHTRDELTLVVVDAAAPERPRRYPLRPGRLWLALLGLLLGLGLLAVALTAFTPLREALPGYPAPTLEHDARLTALRLAAFQDSLAAQQRYATHLRRLITGPINPALTDEDEAGAPADAPASAGEPAEVVAAPRSEDWADHEQPALPLVHLLTEASPRSQPALSGVAHLPALRWPVQPPISGFLTRGFDARTGHYGVDIAVEEGTTVRAIGGGHVILADWTHAGGYALAVQHADGYVSVYKHNQRLLKRAGDRVRDREAIAVSGNSGEVTTGPHLHFELWHDGLAQDPRAYFIGS